MKKQIAVLMAAATAVTTVAPALASAADVNNYEVSASEVTAKMKTALNERYKDKTANGINPSNANEVDAYLNSRYAIVLTGVTVDDENLSDNGLVGFSTSAYGKDPSEKILNALKDNDVFGSEVDTEKLYVVKNASKVQNLIENQVIGQGKTGVQVAIVDKGIKDGSAVETLTDKHYVVEAVASDSADSDTKVSLTNAANELAQKMVGYNGTVKDSYVDTLKVNLGDGDKEVTINPKTGKISIGGNDVESLVNVNKIKLTLKSGKEYTLEANDKAFNLEKPLDKNGKELELANAAQNIYDQVDSFKFIENKDGKTDTIVLPVGDTDVYTVQDVQASTVELGKIFTKKDGYTKEGADFVNSIVDARNGKNENFGFNYNGVNYDLMISDGNGGYKEPTNPEQAKGAFSDPIIEATSNGYQLRYNVMVKNSNDDLKPVKLQFVIKGDSQKDLNIVLRDLQGSNTVAQGHFTRLEGADRYATAVEVSVEKFDPKNADTVVIVGGEALMDGLSAVPLATAKNAPILLSHPKSGLNDATLNEISRACRDLNRKTVYVVGGENSVPEKAVKQLEDKFGAVVVRVSGSDRYDTSLEVAKRLGYDGDLQSEVPSPIKTESNSVGKGNGAGDKDGIGNGDGDKDGSSGEGGIGNGDGDKDGSSGEGGIGNGDGDKDGSSGSGEVGYDEDASSVSAKEFAGNIFIVGGDGAADAMSISPVAATYSNVADGETIYNSEKNGTNGVTPILVVPKDSVKRSTRDFINKFAGTRYIIGGESTVSTNVYRDLNQNNGASISRIAGSDRFDTNVQILDKFYTNNDAEYKIDVAGAIFASGDNKFLVDAQTAGPLAASKNAPIVLAGSKLTNDQVDLLKNDGLLSGLHSGIYQVGGVVSSDVMSVVVDKLGL